ncbi:nucleotide sugar dehydrogenase [Planococcus shenhongbingii]|uniref:nucleotide sugar dehydrogenase n=1 Tax=Planococcus shenhongbingii TaxID=3058398 RepID=UPI002613F875|nr:nucleotide sugar dehydrogenase [Planococcus sp. N016]WKA57754.1 nucleotide sugar dehydrogenase [Planococcus sp. N016]
MSLISDIKNQKEKISIIGLGYVGLPLAVSFSEHVSVIGFDLDNDKVDMYKSGIDPTKEVGNEKIKQAQILFTADEKDLRQAKIHIVAVPTPINSDKSPNLKPVEEASKIIGRNLVKGSIVVYESTVYPGVTEDVCIPILEQESGLVSKVDFKVGYSPERINPGDQVNKLENIVKIVSGIDDESLVMITELYEIVVKAGIHQASSIKVAEAAKVVENSQRDINIAFMNELAIVFDKMDIKTSEVVEAMNTKWNSLGFYPGLVGGHCIGVDPYYFIYEAQKLGYHSQIILSGRKINDSMGAFIGEAIIKKLILANKQVKQAKVAILGVTFKENCPDIRNSKVFDIVEKLEEYKIKPYLVDPQADKILAKEEYNIDLIDIEVLEEVDCIVLAVAHEEFKEMASEDYNKLFGQHCDDEKVLIDVKSILNQTDVEKHGIHYWSL